MFVGMVTPDEGVPAGPDTMGASQEASGPLPTLPLPILMVLYALVGYLFLRRVWAE